MQKLKVKEKYIEVDEACVDLVAYFNTIGLDTKYCCDGKNNCGVFYIMFEDYIDDEKIEQLLIKYKNKYNHSIFTGKFSKWCRVLNGKIKYNWIYTAYTQKSHENDYKRLLEVDTFSHVKQLKNEKIEENEIIEDTLEYKVFELRKNIDIILQEIMTTLVEMDKGIFVLTLFMIVVLILVHYT